jgi:hypothetical protein
VQIDMRIWAQQFEVAGTDAAAEFGYAFGETAR